MKFYHDINDITVFKLNYVKFVLCKNYVVKLNKENDAKKSHKNFISFGKLLITQKLLKIIKLFKMCLITNKNI